MAAFHMRSHGGGLFVDTIRFFPDTAADPAFEDTGGIVSSIAHTATGKYTITFRKPIFDIKCACVSMAVVGDATDATAQGGVETSTTMVVKTKAGGTNTNFAADANTHVDIVLVTKRNAVHV